MQKKTTSTLLTVCDSLKVKYYKMKTRNKYESKQNIGWWSTYTLEKVWKKIWKIKLSCESTKQCAFPHFIYKRWNIIIENIPHTIGKGKFMGGSLLNHLFKQK